MENRAPEFFARVSERGDDDGSGTKRRGRLRGLIEAGAGHEGIVLFRGREGKWEAERLNDYDYHHRWSVANLRHSVYPLNELGPLRWVGMKSEE